MEASLVYKVTVIVFQDSQDYTEKPCLEKTKIVIVMIVIITKERLIFKKLISCWAGLLSDNKKKVRN